MNVVTTARESDSLDPMTPLAQIIKLLIVRKYSLLLALSMESSRRVKIAVVELLGFFNTWSQPILARISTTIFFV